MPDQVTLNALTTAAHEKDLRVIADASAYTPLRMVQEAKAGVVTHAPFDNLVDDKIIRNMLAENQESVLSLAMMQGIDEAA